MNLAPNPTAAATLAAELALLSERGGRRVNEDAAGHWQSERHLCCVLADGAGGHGGGDVAARLVVHELIGRFCLQPSFDGADLAGLVRATNEALIEQRVAGTAREHMHSTVACLVLDLVERSAHWAHAGDTRLYWFRDGRMVGRTRDHRHAQGGDLNSALGLADERLEVEGADGALELRPGDRFLLCTDGFWECIEEHELGPLLCTAGSARAGLDALASVVRRRAAVHPAHDNYSALAVRVAAAR